MVRFEQRQESLDRTRREIAGEKAAALARVTAKLEVRMARFDAAMAAWRRADTPDERTDRARDCQRALEDARKHLWYLVVQREALGLYGHEALKERYPLPGRGWRASSDADEGPG